MNKKNRIARKATKGHSSKKLGKSSSSSSSSNPKCKKYRNMIKSMGNRGDKSNLTVQALEQHNDIYSKISNDSMDSNDETRSLGMESFATVWSECSNTCFDKLLKNWQSSSALHKEMLSTLAAVTEIIKSKGGKETETEYFAALLTFLENVKTDESAIAIASLLSMAIKRVPPSVLKLKFSESSKIFITVLEKYVDTIHQVLVRGIIHCIAVLLRHQEVIVWNLPSTLKIYNHILMLTVHSKPKLRKAAQHAVCSILKGSDITIQEQSTMLHPASTTTAKFCIKNIEKSGGGKNSTTTLHILELLKEILCVFPSSQLKSTCEVILKIMTLGNTLIISCSLQALHGMFRNKPKNTNLTAELNAQIITALYDYQPNINDSQLLSAWLTVMQEAFCNLHRLNNEFFLIHLPKFFDTTVRCWLNDRKEVWIVTSNVLKTLLQDCVKKIIENSDYNKKNLKFSMLIDKLFQSIERCLKYQYHLAWAYVINVIGICFEVLGKYHSKAAVMIKCLQSLADLRDSINFNYTKELDNAVGKAVITMGPDVILEAIPLNLNLESNKLDFPRSWLLPVIRDNVRETKLEYFTNYFLPIASKLQKKVTECEALNHNIEAKVYSVIQSQIWSMLPGFCTNPIDFPQSFKGIAKILGTALTARPDLCLDILASLRILIKKNMDNEINRKEMTRYAKNYLPILFNLYTTEPKGSHEESVRLAVFDTIKIYLQISEKELCETLYQKAIEKLKDPHITCFNRHALLDISRILIPFVNESSIQLLFDYCLPLLQTSDKTIQKKSYRVLEEMCQNNSNYCETFIKNHIQELKELLLASLLSLSPPSKAPRLRCLRNIVCQLNNDNIDFVKSIIPEAVFCVKESAEKIREAAYSLIVEIGNCFLRWNSGNPSEAIRHYVEMLLAGLTGNPHFISATLLCLGRVLFEFKDKMPSDVIYLLIEDASLLLSSSSREIVKSVLSFIKSLFASLETSDLIQYVEIIVKNLIKSISKDGQRQLRFKAKEIFTRLIRKFGFDMISKLIPESHKKYITNIHKTEARKQKNKIDKSKTLKYNVNEDSDMDYSNDENRHINSVSKSTEEWIEENNEEIIDFLDSRINKKILATKPKKMEKEEFKTAPDGRLIIINNEDISKNKRKANDDDCLLDEAENLPTEKRQRIISENVKFKEATVDHSAQNKGIHRRINKSERIQEYGKEFKSKKAGGDIKKKGRPNPYAYITLNRKTLSRRKKAKISGQFKGIVRAAHKGSQKGKKRKLRREN